MIVDEVVISVEVTNQASGGAAPAPTETEDRQAIVEECVERVLEILRSRRKSAEPWPTRTLEKLMIQAFEKPDYSGSPVVEFEAYVNPTRSRSSYEMEYDSAQGSGTTNSRMEFKKVKPGDLSLTFFLDGTGANGRRENVQARSQQFQKVTGYNGNIHRPNYLKVGWGTIEIKRCVLKSASIAYKLFKPDGVPLRAVITATLHRQLRRPDARRQARRTSRPT